MNRNASLVMIDRVADALGDFDVVFVGGATLALYVTDDRDVRGTDDVDCVVEIATYSAFAKFESTLRKRGFNQPANTTPAPACRWWLGDIVVDVVASTDSPLGPSNRWYGLGFNTAVPRALPSGRTIRVLRPAFFFGSKLAAYLGRGAKDPLFSRDLEDLVMLLARCPELEGDIATAPDELREYIASWSAAFLAEGYADELIEGHLGGRDVGPRRAAVVAVLERLARP